MMMKENEYIQEVIGSNERSLTFFSNEGKPERELWVVREFLRNLKIDFKEEQVVPIKPDPPDVKFEDARFEIKELDVKGRRRHLEVKEDLQRARLAKTIKELLVPWEGRDISFKESSDRVVEEVKRLVYDPSFCKGTDLLFYLNFSLKDSCRKKAIDPSLLGTWRSVSMVTNNNISYVFWATDAAPLFLKTAGQ